MSRRAREESIFNGIHPFSVPDILKNVACFLFRRPLLRLENMVKEYDTNKEACRWDHGLLMTLRLSTTTRLARLTLAPLCFEQGMILWKRFCSMPKVHRFSLDACTYCDKSPSKVYCHSCAQQCVNCKQTHCEDCREFADFKQCHECSDSYCEYCAIDKRQLPFDETVCRKCNRAQQHCHYLSPSDNDDCSSNDSSSDST